MRPFPAASSLPTAQPFCARRSGICCIPSHLALDGSLLEHPHYMSSFCISQYHFYCHIAQTLRLSLSNRPPVLDYCANFNKLLCVFTQKNSPPHSKGGGVIFTKPIRKKLGKMPYSPCSTAASRALRAAFSRSFSSTSSMRYMARRTRKVLSRRGWQRSRTSNSP